MKQSYTVQQVYWILKDLYDSKTAEEILDSLEDNPTGYYELVEQIFKIYNNS